MDTAMKNAVELKREIRRALGNYPKVTKVEVLGLEGEGLMIAVRYHTTDVVKLYLNKAGYAVLSVVVTSGGWISKTTAERINAVLRHLKTGFFVRFTYKRQTFVRGTMGRQMGDSLYDQKFTLVGQGIEMPFEDGMTFKRSRDGFKLTYPGKAAQKRLAKVVPAEKPVDDPPPCFYCKSDDHASHNCEDRHR